MSVSRQPTTAVSKSSDPVARALLLSEGCPCAAGSDPVCGGGGMDNNGLWLRLYTDLYRNGKVRILPESLQIRFVWILCLHKEGKLVGRDLEQIAWDLRCDADETRKFLKDLQDADLLLPDFTPKGWQDRQYQSDTSTERVRKHRAKEMERFGNVTETVQSRVEKSREETEQSRVDPLSGDTRQVVENVLTYLNSKSGKKFATSGSKCEASAKLVADRLKQGYTEQELCRVVDMKVNEWRGRDMDKYLRPATLFNKTKFEQYMGELNATPKYQNIVDRMREEQELLGGGA